MTPAQALGGLAVSFVFRYADNLLKSFAVGCSIALNSLMAWVLFGFALTRVSAVGVILVAAASTLYALPPHALAASCPLAAASAIQTAAASSLKGRPPRYQRISTVEGCASDGSEAVERLRVAEGSAVETSSARGCWPSPAFASPRSDVTIDVSSGLRMLSESEDGVGASSCAGLATTAARASTS